LADNYEKSEKTFTNKKIGKVLGFWIDLEELSLKLTDEKAEEAMVRVEKAANSEAVRLTELQSVL
jgi:hypothetical protein